MPLPSRNIVSIASQHYQPTLSKAQKTFNRLIEQIDEFIVGSIVDIAESADGDIDAELKALYNLHNRSDFDVDVAEERAMFAERDAQGEQAHTAQQARRKKRRKKVFAILCARFTANWPAPCIRTVSPIP